ncbi:MAG: chromosome segregation protein SMC [Anaerolineae bacterium]|nr:ATP-binding protein [Anaerolineales bacterium]MCQ3979326.1 chromosome segregation protein SMC [Anaerolineae bacterium]
MLTQLTVRGFKSLQNVENLELGMVNVFIGANGSGKSNLLEAIGLLSAATSNQLDDQALLRRGVRPSTLSLYQSSFKETQILKHINIYTVWGLFGGDTVEYQVEFDTTISTRWQNWAYKQKFKRNNEEGSIIRDVHQDGPRSIIKNPDFLDELEEDWQEILSDYAIFSPNTSTLRGTTPDITQRQPVGLAGGQLAEAVGELLDGKRDAFGALGLDELFELLDWVDGIAVVSPSRELVSASVPTLRNIIRFTDRWMDKDSNQLSAYDASEGALYVLFALVLALHPKSPRLFAIDNLDQAMHPRLARATARIFCQQMLKANPTRQALLTTHNPLVLDGLDLRDDRIRLFAVERNSYGATQVYRVQVSDEVLQATQAGLTLSNLWLMGRLGGVPDLF